ncbi:unnamed protein product [Parnassius apollo]|uniref:(apollo) hypothetical protein n=1 Tax=Parnassius apollo TaxID=110799 RepID=A0A8S3XWJ3_PARAO|nr:unnamed protein product [Parnassius apollo]
MAHESATGGPGPASSPQHAPSPPHAPRVPPDTSFHQQIMQVCNHCTRPYTEMAHESATGGLGPASSPQHAPSPPHAPRVPPDTSFH